MDELEGFPRTTIEVFGLRSSARIEALIDTGFDGDICLPATIAENLGLVLNEQTVIVLADGSRKLELGFGGEVEFLGQRQYASFFVFDRPTALVGNRLMRDCQLVIDYAERKVSLFRSVQKKKKK